MPPTRSSVAYVLVLFGLAGVLCVGLMGYMRRLERRAIESPAIRDQLTQAGRARPLAEVTRLLQQMKLVTVAVDTTVTSESAQESWRGNVEAKVEAPVRLYYGTDLSKLSVQDLAFSPARGGYLVKIPAPERVSTEVCGDAENNQIQVGWMRLRSRAGEYYLGLARKDLYARAKELSLSPADARMVRKTTKEQTEALVKQIVGARTPVTVAFEDGEP